MLALLCILSTAMAGQVGLTGGMEFTGNDPFVTRRGHRIGVEYAPRPQVRFGLSGAWYPDLGEGNWTPLTSQLVTENHIAPDISLMTGQVRGTLRVVPFIVTLGTLLLVRGLAKGLADEQKIDVPLSWLIELLAALSPEMRWLIVPPGVWLLLLLAIGVGALLRSTPVGRHIVATGSSEATARLCGIRVERIKTGVYMASGAAAGLAGVMQFSRLTVGDPTVAVGLELDVIAAVVIGGGSLSGGEGSILGTLVGALIMTVIRSGCSQMGLPNWVQEIVTGTIIVVAVALDRWRHRR